MSLNIKVVQKALKKAFGRRHIQNYDLCVDAIKKMGLPEFYKDHQTTILDAYPGAGIWSAALYNTLKPVNHVMLEPVVGFQKYLKPLIEDSAKESELNVHLRSEDPFRWSTFTDLAKEGVFQPRSAPRDQINPFLLYTANLTSIQGEQLCVQYLNCIMNQNWIQQYGRVRLLLWVRHTTASKLLGRAGGKHRQRVSVQTEACSDTRLVISSSHVENLVENPEQEAPFSTVAKDMFPDSSAKSQQVVLLQIDPIEKPIENIDYFEYVIRTLFILKSRPLKEAIGILGPGAQFDLTPKLDPALLKKAPTEMKLEEFEEVTRVFAAWPFKPDILHDFYEEFDAPGPTHV